MYAYRYRMLENSGKNYDNPIFPQKGELTGYHLHLKALYPSIQCCFAFNWLIYGHYNCTVYSAILEYIWYCRLYCPVNSKIRQPLRWVDD